jgi:hypothetical protein
MTSVRMTSYSDSSSNPERATLIPTMIPQIQSLKTQFHLVNSTVISIVQKLTSEMADTEKQWLNIPFNTIKVDRTEFIFDNIDVRRNVLTDVNILSVFLFPIQLQTRKFTLSNADFSITGTIF